MHQVMLGLLTAATFLPESAENAAPQPTLKDPSDSSIHVSRTSACYHAISKDGRAARVALMTINGEQSGNVSVLDIPV